MALRAPLLRGRLPRVVRGVVLALPRGITRLRRSPPPEGPALVGLVLLSVLSVVGRHAYGALLFPPVLQVLPLLGGGLLLRRASMRALMVVVAACLAYDVTDVGMRIVRPGSLVVVIVTAVVS